MASWRLNVLVVGAMLLGCGCEKKSGPPVAAPAAKVMPPVAAKTLVVADVDGFPSGQETAEGAACDFRRAYLNLDGELMRKVCFVITPGSPERDAYNNSIDETITAMDVAKTNNRPLPRGLLKVYKARALSSAAAQKFGAEELRLTSVMFVDVRVAENVGEPDAVRRMLVVRDEGSGLWYVVPRAELFPKLSEGLDGESASVEEWKK